jgi:hypothetical protein
VAKPRAPNEKSNQKAAWLRFDRITREFISDQQKGAATGLSKEEWKRFTMAMWAIHNATKGDWSQLSFRLRFCKPTELFDVELRLAADILDGKLKRKRGGKSDPGFYSKAAKIQDRVKELLCRDEPPKNAVVDTAREFGCSQRWVREMLAIKF